MKKKIALLFLSVLLTVTLAFSVTACNKDGDTPAKQHSIVYLGDSIAEAILGPSPLIERESYGYYSLIGRCNDFKYYNRSVSGHRTIDMYNYITQNEEDGALMTKSLIKSADIIHISILGNDFLQSSAKDPVTGLTGLGAMLVQSIRNDFSIIDDILELSVGNFAGIVAVLKEYNPRAKIFFQTVYNPVYPETTMIDAESRGKLDSMSVTPAQYREKAQVLIEKLNNVIWDYLDENPGAYDVVDACAAFAKIHNDLGAEKGRSLIFADWVHPSNYGHAVIADTFQSQLEKLGFAGKNALSEYKKIRKSQLDRLYTNAFEDIDAKKAAIDSATTRSAATEAYFDATDGITPVYNPELKDEFVKVDSSSWLSEDMVFDINLNECSVMNLPLVVVSSFFDSENCFIKLTADGKMQFKLQIAPDSVNNLIPVLEDFLKVDSIYDWLNDTLAEAAKTANISEILESFINSYVATLFPGADFDNIPAAFGLLKQALGLEFTGIDFQSETMTNLIDSIIQNNKLPEDFVIPSDLVIGINLENTYELVTLKDVDGVKHTAVYIGDRTANGQPFAIFTMTDEEGFADGDETLKQLSLRVEFVKLSVCAVERAA